MAIGDQGKGAPGRPPRVVAIGECMMELSPADGQLLRLGFGATR